MSTVTKSGIECVTPRRHGGGDGISQNSSGRKRVPVSSARKLAAKTPRNYSLKLQLETALGSMCGKEFTPKRHQVCLQKSASVAEITPTTTKAKRRIVDSTTASPALLYATPRPFEDAPKIHHCPRGRAACALSRRLMLLAWRRTRTSRLALSETLKKREDQVNQLEMQVDVLNKLRTSEGQKRDEALNECQKLKKSVEILEFENSQLSEDTQNLQNTLEILQNDLKMSKSTNNFLSEQTIKMQDIIGKKNVEKRSLDEQITLCKQEIVSQKAVISHLEESLRSTEKNLQNTGSNLKVKERKYGQLKCDYKTQVDLNASMSKQLQSLREEKNQIDNKLEVLENQLNDYIRSCELLKNQNDELKTDINEISVVLDEEKKQTWVKNTKQFALLSLSALQKIAYVMLPAYVDIPQE